MDLLGGQASRWQARASEPPAPHRRAHLVRLRRLVCDILRSRARVGPLLDAAERHLVVLGSQLRAFHRTLFTSPVDRSSPRTL